MNLLASAFTADHSCGTTYQPPEADGTRYVVADGSATSHCCFTTSVIDTQTHDIMCECLELSEAKLICDALNAYAGGGR